MRQVKPKGQLSVKAGLELRVFVVSIKSYADFASEAVQSVYVVIEL